MTYTYVSELTRTHTIFEAVIIIREYYILVSEKRVARVI